MTPCPHCGAALTPPVKICPFCGVILADTWPPAPSNFDRPIALPLPKTLTGRVWTDFIAGVVAQYLVHLATARVMIRYVPTTSQSRDRVAQALAPGSFVLTEMFWAVVLGLLLYYGVKPFYPVIARGAGHGLLWLLVVLLGAFITCQPLLY